MSDYAPTSVEFVDSLGEPTNELTPMEIARKYSKLVELKKQVDERYKQYREQLLDATKSLGVISLKTEEYTITRQTRKTIRISNHEVATEELKLRNIPIVTKTVLDEDYMMPAIKQLVEKDGELIPGIETSATEFVTVRQAK